MKQMEVYNPDIQINTVVIGGTGFAGYIHGILYESQAHPSGFLLEQLHDDCSINPTDLLYCSCSTHQYFNLTTGNCESNIYIHKLLDCHPSCERCYGPTNTSCPECKPGVTALKGHHDCVTIPCAPGHYLSSFGVDTCESCAQNCNRCDQTGCLECKLTLNGDISGTCYDYCPSKYYLPLAAIVCESTIYIYIYNMNEL